MNQILTHKESQPKSIKSNLSFFKPTIQKKLSIDTTNDSYEVEADNMANKVMRMTEPSQQNVSQTGALVQRKCTACEQEEKIQKKSLAENITPFIQCSSPEGGGQASSHIESQINSSRGGGSSLDSQTKSFMENRFGVDFSDVKIHTGSQAVQMSRELNAQAFTVGNDIYFNEGKYSPNSDSGKHLLAHELTHTVQQSGGIGKKVQRFVTCETQEDCPPRETGEVVRSRSEPFELFNLTSGGVGMLISNFAVNSGNIDGDLTLNPRWNTFVSDLITNTHLTWEILGFTDCQGDEALNSNLRTLRATEFYFALPEAARAQVETYGAAPSSSCMRTNSTEANRKLNRSAIIRLKTTRYDFEEETVRGIVTQLECSDGRDISRNSDNDLDKVPHAPQDRSPDIFIYDNVLGESGALSDFRIGFFTGTSGESTTDDNRLFNHFLTGSGSSIDFPVGSDMSRIIGSTDAVTQFSQQFEQSVIDYFNIHNSLSGYNCQSELIRTRPGYIGKWDSLFSVAVMGGYQRLEARIQIRDGILNIRYRIFDHYGGGVNDAWSYLPGLSGLYYLQHYVTGSTNTYQPFIWSVDVNKRRRL
ncbi:eCIS core domain-containing protein [Flavobacterium sp. HNIBRBA15423]|uniref:eCIS core domain-containing protein n=1 Tax=Flavobacterium sp. HNIBRBA15423 TaxID=3458683 RepID=UPI004044D6DE